MKIFKTTLAIIILCGANSIFAARKEKTGPTTPPAPTIETPTQSTLDLTTKTYYELLPIIKTLPAAKVVDNAGNLQNEFIKTISSNSKLSPIEKEALLQAGTNIHINWTGNAALDKANLTKTSSQIAQAINRYYREEPIVVPGIEPIKFEIIEKKFDPNYLENTVAKIVKDKGFVIKGESATSQKNRLVGLVKNAMINEMTPAFGPNKLEDLKTLVNKTLHDKIVTLVEEELIRIQAQKSLPQIPAIEKPGRTDEPILFTIEQPAINQPKTEPVKEEVKPLVSIKQTIKDEILEKILPTLTANQRTQLKMAYDKEFGDYTSITYLEDSKIVFKVFNNYNSLNFTARDALIEVLNEIMSSKDLANGTPTRTAVESLWNTYRKK